MTQITTAENLNDLSILEFHQYFEEALLNLLELARLGDREKFEVERLKLCERIRSFLPDKPIDSPEIEEIASINNALLEIDPQLMGRSFYEFMQANLDLMSRPTNEQ